MHEWFLDAGDEDEGGFNNAVESLSKILMSHGISVEHHIYPGHHNLQYVKSNILKYLIFTETEYVRTSTSRTSELLYKLSG